MGLRRHNPDHRRQMDSPRLGRMAVAVVIVVAAGLGPAVAGAQIDVEAERDAVRDRQARIADEIDVLSASDADIDAALDELEAAIASQGAAVTAARTAAAEARAEVGRAERRLRAAQRDVALVEDAIREMAVASYMHPPAADLVTSLQASSFSDALVQKVYLDARANRDLSLLDLLERAEATAASEAELVAVAALAAEEAAAATEAELVRLQAEQDRQVDFAVDLRQRIDGALAEAAVLADLDAQLSAELAAQQAALLERLPPIPPPPTTAPPASTSTTAPAAADGEPEAEVAAPPRTTTSTTSPPRTSSTRPTSTPPLRTVQGFTVHADIADDVDAMLTAAAADGISFGGSGYRSTERQIELRRANCGPSDYEVYDAPSSSCSPPTARPGTSLHEQGRAIDFTFNGRLITSRDNDGFRWLAENASTYGLFNLPVEPWHWSTTGG